MKIWRLQIDEKSIGFAYKSSEDLIFDKVTGSSALETWKPIPLITRRKGTKRDFTMFHPAIPVFVGRTKALLEPCISDFVEFLPTDHDELELWFVNVTNVLDCVDRSASVEHRISGGILHEYTKIAFFEDKLDNRATIFRIPDVMNTLYVNDTFRDVVVKNKLKGIELIEAWDSAFTEDMQKEQQERYQATLASIEHAKGKKLSYSEAVKLVESGKAVAHKTWKMQLNKKGVSVIGTLKEDNTYQWIIPAFIPPIFLEVEWVEVERSDN